MSFEWYVLRSKPRKENVVAKQLLDRNVEVYFPQLRVQPVNPRSQKIKPYFPGYLFIRIDLEKTGLSDFHWLPHSIGLVMCGDEPSAVPDNLVQTIREQVDEKNQAKPEYLDGLKHGEEVRIQFGPFEGYEALFDVHIAGSERVRVLLKFLDDRRVPVDLPAVQLARKNPKA